MIMGPNDPRAMRTFRITFTGEDGETATVEKFTSGDEIAELVEWLKLHRATNIVVETPYGVGLGEEASEIIADFFAFEAAVRKETT